MPGRWQTEDQVNAEMYANAPAGEGGGPAFNKAQQVIRKADGTFIYPSNVRSQWEVLSEGGGDWGTYEQFAQQNYANANTNYWDEAKGMFYNSGAMDAENFDSGGMFDWGDMMAPGALLLGPFAGMMAGAAGGLAGAGAGSGVAGGLAAGELGGMATSALGNLGGSAFSVGGAGAAASVGSDAWFEQLMQNFNPDLGFQGMNELGYLSPTLPSTPSMPPADPSGTNPNLIETPTPGFNPSAGTPPATGTGSALSRVIEAMTNGGTPAMADILSLGGSLGSTLLGMYGSNQQAGSLREIADRSRADRQPFLDKSLEWMRGGPAGYAADVGKSSLDAVLRGLSVNGNPFSNATSLALAGDMTNRNWQNAVTGFGNIGLSGSDSRNQLLTGAVNADAGGLNALGYGLENIFNPKPKQQSLSDFARQFGLV